MAKRKERRKKECITHTVIHFRDYGKMQDPRYCVDVECTTHGSNWSCLTNDFEMAGKIAHAFPLVNGGLAMGKDAFSIPDDCILGKIPQKPFASVKS